MPDFSFKHTEQADKPNVSADTMKANFDSQAVAIRDYINSTLKTEVDAKADADSLATHKADKSPHPNMPNAQAKNTLSQSIPTETKVILNLNTTIFDNDNIHNPSVNNNRLTCHTTGKYLIIGQVVFAPNATGNRRLTILKNGAVALAEVLDLAASIGFQYMITSTVANLNAGDYVTLGVRQESGVAIDSIATDTTPMLSMIKVG
jgi:hypothetical protein